MSKRRPIPQRPEGWNDRAEQADDALRDLGIGSGVDPDDVVVWTAYPHVSLRLEYLEELINLARIGADS